MNDALSPRTLVSIIVPFYNEAENVALLHQEIAAAFNPLPEYEYECVYVNDGSTDDTGAVIDDLVAGDARARAIHFPRNYGQSAALLIGLKCGRGDLLLTLDGDLQNDPADIPQFLRLLRDHDCVCGYRLHRHDAFIRRAAGRIANMVRGAALHDGLRDAGCGAKGFHRKCIEHLPPFNGVHRFIGVFMRKAGFNLVECPVKHRGRLHGVSKYGINDRLWRGLYDLFGVAWLRRRHVVPVYEIKDNTTI